MNQWLKWTALSIMSIISPAVAASQSPSTSPPPWLIEKLPSSPSMSLFWQTEPGVRYDLWQSTDLITWFQAPSYPKAAESLSLQFSFFPGKSGFFRFFPIDEQPPTVIDQFPASNGFAVSRFAPVSIVLNDYSGIDSSSIRLKVGQRSQIAVGAPGLSFSENTISFDPGGVPLGEYSETVLVELTALDTVGNRLNYNWTFKLEPEPQVAPNIFVFGSISSQKNGQIVSGPAVALAKRGFRGPITKDPASSAWNIMSVSADRVVIKYTGTNGVQLSPSQLICNLTPKSESEIFYRRVISTSDDSVLSELTVFTEDAALTDFVSQGAASMSENSVAYKLDEASNLSQSLSVEGDVTFPRIGFDLTGSTLKLRPDGYDIKVPGFEISLGDDIPWIELEAKEWSWWYTPRVRASLEIGFGSLKAFEAIASGDISSGNAFEAHVVIAGLSVEHSFQIVPPNSGPRVVFYLGQLGPVPVFGVLSLEAKIKVKAEAQAAMNISFSYNQDFSVHFGLAYKKDSGVEWIKGFQYTSPNLDYSALLTNSFSTKVTLIPQADFLVYGLAGFAASLEPHLGIEVEFPNGKFRGNLDVGVDFALQPAGPAFAFLPDEFKLSFPIVESEWPLTRESLAFKTQPISQTVVPGDDVTLTCAVQSESAPSFQWFHRGLQIPGQISRSLFLSHVNSGHSGSYYVRATANGEVDFSNTAVLTVTNATPENLDTDKDGLPDAVETNTGIWISSNSTGTNPLKSDSDGDGLSDGVETNTGVFLSQNDTGTNPNLFDSDHDGADDKTEIRIGSDPNAPPSSFITLAAGSIAFVAVNARRTSGGNDEPWAWVALQTIPPQTIIWFTDAGIGMSGGKEAFNGEARTGWISQSSLSAGSVVRWTGKDWSTGNVVGPTNARTGLNNSGDNLFAYQIVSTPPYSSSANPDPSKVRFLAGIVFNTQGRWLTDGSLVSTNSNIPQTALLPLLSEPDGTANSVAGLNISYDGAMTAAAVAVWLSRLSDDNNWRSSFDASDDNTAWPTSLPVR